MNSDQIDTNTPTIILADKNQKKIRGRPRKPETEKLYNPEAKYSTEYYRLHKTDKIKCEICGKTINRFIKSNHQKTEKCILGKIKKIIDEYSDEINELLTRSPNDPCCD